MIGKVEAAFFDIAFLPSKAIERLNIAILIPLYILSIRMNSEKLV
jgi:hypothetical protein